MRNSTKFLTSIVIIFIMIFIYIYPMFSLAIGLTILVILIILYPILSIIDYYTMLEYEKEEYDGWNPLVKLLRFLDYGMKNN